MLFQFVIDWVLKRSLGEHPSVLLINGIWITELKYTSNFELLVEDTKDIQALVDRPVELGF